MRTGVMAALAALTMVSLSGCAALLLIPQTGSLSNSSNSSNSTGSSGQSGPIQSYSDGTTSERGNISKAIGERAGEKNVSGTQRLDTFVVTRIIADPPCLNSAAPPTNGHYLEVDMTVTTTDALGQDGTAFTLDLSPSNWYYYPGGGNGGVGASVATDNCQVAVPPLTTLVGPNVTTTGSIVLDVNDNSHWIAFAPYSNAPGWEWPYAAPAS
jgi:hypothetical protein